MSPPRSNLASANNQRLKIKNQGNDCKNETFCMWAIGYRFIGNLPSSVTLFVHSRSYKMLDPP